jgi:hypothetical protein
MRPTLTTNTDTGLFLQVQSSQCRISKRENFFRIVNGYIPEPHQFKFMVTIFVLFRELFLKLW